MGQILAFSRIAAFSLLLLFYVPFFLVVHAVFKLSIDQRFKIRGLFCRINMKILGVEVEKEGYPVYDQASYMIICNHRSLLDPMVCAKYLYAFYLSKAEVANYPLIGIGSKLTGVIFVNRDDKTSRKSSKNAIRDTLLEGKNVLLYPEGTTNGNDLTKMFYKGSFEVAHDINVKVVPVVLEYENRNDYWTGGGLLAKSVQQFSKWKTKLHLYIGEPVTAESAEDLMKECQFIMDKKIREIQVRYGNISSEKETV